MAAVSDGRRGGIRWSWVLVVGLVVGTGLAVWSRGQAPEVRLPDGSVLAMADMDSGTRFRTFPHGFKERVRSLVPGWAAKQLGLDPVAVLEFPHTPGAGLLVTLTTTLPEGTAVPASSGGFQSGNHRYWMEIEGEGEPRTQPLLAGTYVGEANLDARTVVERHFFGVLPRKPQALVLKVYRLDDLGLTNVLQRVRIPNPVREEPWMDMGEAPPVTVSVQGVRAVRVKGLPMGLADDLDLVFRVEQKGNGPKWLPVQLLEVGDEGGNRALAPNPVRPQAGGSCQVKLYHAAFPGDTARVVVLEFAEDGGTSPDLTKTVAATRRKLKLRLP